MQADLSIYVNQQLPPWNLRKSQPRLFFAQSQFYFGHWFWTRPQCVSLDWFNIDRFFFLWFFKIFIIIIIPPVPDFDTLTSHFTKWQSMIMLQLTHVALMPFCRNAVFWNSIVHVYLYLLFVFFCLFVFCGNGFLFLVDAAFSFVFSAQFSIWWHEVVHGSLQAEHCFSYTLFSPIENVKSFTEIFVWYIFRCFVL